MQLWMKSQLYDSFSSLCLHSVIRGFSFIPERRCLTLSQLQLVFNFIVWEMKKDLDAHMKSEVNSQELVLLHFGFWGLNLVIQLVEEVFACWAILSSQWMKFNLCHLCHLDQFTSDLVTCWLVTRDSLVLMLRVVHVEVRGEFMCGFSPSTM